MRSKLTRFKEEYLIELGRIVVNANELESYISSAILLLTSESNALSEEYRLIMSVVWRERFDKLLQVLEAIFTEKIENPRLIKKFAVIKEKAKSLNQKRNGYIHSRWLFAEDDSYVGRMRNLKSLRIEHEVRPPVGKLSKLADDLSSCAGELYSFIYEVKMIVEREKAV